MKKLLVSILFLYGATLSAKGSRVDLEEKIQERIMQYMKTHVVAAKSSLVSTYPQNLEENNVVPGDSLSLDARNDSIVVSYYVLGKGKSPKLNYSYVYSKNGVLISKRQFNGCVCTSLSEYNSQGQPTLQYNNNTVDCDEGQKDSFYLAHREEYNTIGQHTASYSYSADGTLYHKNEYRYNQKGDLIESIIYQCRQNLRDISDSLNYIEYARSPRHTVPLELHLSRRTVYHMDSINRVSITEEYSDSLLDFKTTKYYDDQWRVVKKSSDNYTHYTGFARKQQNNKTDTARSAEQYSETIQYVYGSSKQTEILLVNGNKIQETVTAVNENNEPLEVVTNCINPIYNKRETYSYDANGNLINQNWSGGEKGITSTTMTIYYR
jgi:hypothetical protein